MNEMVIVEEVYDETLNRMVLRVIGETTEPEKPGVIEKMQADAAQNKRTKLSQPPKSKQHPPTE